MDKRYATYYEQTLQLELSVSLILTIITVTSKNNVAVVIVFRRYLKTAESFISHPPVIQFRNKLCIQTFIDSRNTLYRLWPLNYVDLF